MGLASFNRMRRLAAEKASTGKASKPVIAAPAVDDGYPSDDELRAVIEAATGKAPHHKAGRAKLIDQYNATKTDPQDETASNGLTRREIEADLTAMEVDFDPADKLDDLAALRDLAREERDKAGA
jgi:hypothetical protein